MIDGSRFSQPELQGPDIFPFLPEVLRRQLLDTAAFQSDEEEAAEAEARRKERIQAQKDYALEQEQGRRLARAEMEQAKISGQLDPDAEAFRDLTLKPRVKEAHDFTPKVRTPVVQGLFFRDTLAWVAGPSGTFKSFVTADLAFRYGQDDMDFHGMRMTSGRSLLIVAEGAAGYADRKTAWEKEHGREVKNVSIYPAPLQLGDTLKEMPALISYLREEEDAGRPFGLVVFDTQAMCTVGVEENGSEMNLVVNMLHRIREVSGACVLVVHHFGKDKRAGMRGSSMIQAAADTVCVLKRKDDELDVTLSTSQADEGKQKDAETQKDFLTLEMKSQAVGEDYFGDPVWSLVPLKADTASTEVHGQPEDVPQSLNEVTVTDKQMPYLRALTRFRHHGAGQTELARLMSEESGQKVYGSLVRSTLIGLEVKHVVELDHGKWKITPLGNAVLLREQSERAATEEAWSNRPRRMFRAGVSEGQENIDHGTSETLSEHPTET